MEKSIKLQTLKGFRDFLPGDSRKRQYVVNALRAVFESYGFEPLETPALEYEEVLMGKYGEEGDKLMYRFEDNGGRRVALRYDQTVPLARVVAQYPDLPKPFKRYQIQPVWRAENPQKGRYREFLQCDADIVGTNSPISDAEVLALTSDSLKKLGFKNFKILINDRNVFSRLDVPKEDLSKVITAIDKLKKIGEEGVIQELVSRGMTKKDATTTLQCVVAVQETDRVKQVLSLLERYGLKKGQDFEFSPTLARGLDYYTGIIFEVEIEGYSAGSVGGGGRYDKLIGLFAGHDIPAVGIAFGFDRLIDAMEELKLFPQDIFSPTAQVLVTIFSPELVEKSLEAEGKIREAGINVEVYPDENAKLDKQLKYADRRGIPYVVIIGQKEAEANIVALRDMKAKSQKEITLETAVNLLQPSSELKDLQKEAAQ